MKSRKDVLVNAIDECLKEVYTLVQPSVEWDDFLKQNKEFLEKEEEYYKIPEKDRPKYFDYMGPKPYEFYYLPKEVFKEVVDSYVYAYDLDKHQGLLDTIKILKDYCNKPIVDKYIEGELREDGTRGPGHRGYDHPDNLEKEINKIIDDEDLSQLLCNKFFKFLDMAGEFFNWNGELNSFYTSVYLGPSPNSNKEAVIDNWKQYRNKEIEIDDEKYNDEEQDFD
jgi:hypothetical protein